MSISRPHCGRGGSRHCGRLRIRAAKILSTGFGWEVFPDEIRPATGRWRTDWRMDVYRWELFTRKDGNPNMPYVAGCWESLTDFVKQAATNGFHVSDDRVIYPGAK